MQCLKSSISGIKMLRPERIEDERGWLMECFRPDDLCFFGVKEHFVQENHTFTRQAGTLRGLHFQLPPCAQSKLIRCTAGRSLHVAVDIRPESRTAGKWVMEELSAESGCLLYIPKGFAHGYLTLTDNVEIQDKVDMNYIAKAARSLYYADPALAIPWGMEPTVISEKDSKGSALSWKRYLKWCENKGSKSGGHLCL